MKTEVHTFFSLFIYAIKIFKHFDYEKSSIEILILFDNVSSDSAPIIKSKIYGKINQKLLKLFAKKLQVNVNESSTLKSTLLQDMHNGVHVEIHIRSRLE